MTPLLANAMLVREITINPFLLVGETTVYSLNNITSAVLILSLLKFLTLRQAQCLRIVMQSIPIA